MDSDVLELTILVIPHHTVDDGIAVHQAVDSFQFVEHCHEDTEGHAVWQASGKPRVGTSGAWGSSRTCLEFCVSELRRGALQFLLQQCHWHLSTQKAGAEGVLREEVWPEDWWRAAHLLVLMEEQSERAQNQTLARVLFT